MKKIFFISLSLLMFSCTKKDNTNEEIYYYPFSLNKQVNNAIDILDNNATACKTIIMENIIDCKNISRENIITDLESFREFDLNKAAWQNSFVKIDNPKYTRFKSVEKRLALQHIDVYGSLNNPEKIRIYFHNKNNLYESVKLIEWKPGISYSIFSIQDVKGMDADTLFVKARFPQQKIIKSAEAPDLYHQQVIDTTCFCKHK